MESKMLPSFVLSALILVAFLKDFAADGEL